MIKSCYGMNACVTTAVRLCSSSTVVRESDFPMIKAPRPGPQEPGRSSNGSGRKRTWSLWKKRQLELEEKVNEDQVKMCEMLAAEKKKRKKAPR